MRLWGGVLFITVSGCAAGASATDPGNGFGDGSGTMEDDAAGGEGGSGDDGGGGADGTVAGEGGAGAEVGLSDDAASDDAEASSGSGDDGGGTPGDGGGTPSDAGGDAMNTDARPGDASAPVDASSDKCAAYGDTCGDCTQGRIGYNCGWCNGGCFTGTSSGPSKGGVCASTSWVWSSSHCP